MFTRIQSAYEFLATEMNMGVLSDLEDLKEQLEDRPNATHGARIEPFLDLRDPKDLDDCDEIAAAQDFFRANHLKFPMT